MKRCAKWVGVWGCRGLSYTNSFPSFPFFITSIPRTLHENTVLVLESGNGIVLESLHRNTKDGLMWEVIKGRALRNKDMVFVVVFRKL